MITKSLTSPSFKIFKSPRIFGIYNTMPVIRNFFYQIEVIKMMRNYLESLEISPSPNQLCIPDYPYRILIISGSGSGKTNPLLNLIKHEQHDIDKIYLCVKDQLKSNYQLLINRREIVGINKLQNPNALINYSQTSDVVYENLEDYNPTKTRKVLIVFDDIIADMALIKNSILQLLNCSEDY